MSAHDLTKATAKMPFAEFILGGAGVFPLTTLASMIVTGITVPGVDSTYALMTYGAIVLAYMGGVHWGLTMVDAGAYAASRWGTSVQWRRYIATMVPGLAGWVAVLMPIRAGAWTMIAAFALLTLYDMRCVRLGEAPPWFLKLRAPLAIAAAGSLFVGIILRS